MINFLVRLLLTIMVVLLQAALPASAGSDGRFRVGEVEFCVPSSAVVDIDIPWIPRELSKDGFVFQLQAQELPALIPALDIRGKKVPLIGSVTPSGTNSVDSSLKLFARRVDDPESIIERNASNGLVSVYESSRRAHWTVWQLPFDVTTSADSLERLGKLIGVCSKPAGASAVDNWKGSQATCQRRFYLGLVKVDYSVDLANLEKIDWIDKQVKNYVTSWQCPKSK